MAQQDIVGSLFGVTPESYQQARVARDTATNLSAAQLAPGQLAGYYAMEAGTGLGRAIPGLLGIEDPQMKAVSTAAALAKQFDVTTPDGLKAYAGALQQAGLPQFASMAVDRLNALNKSAFDVLKTQSEIAKNFKDAEKAGQIPEGTIKEIAATVKNNKILLDTNEEASKWQSMVDNNQIKFNLGANLKGWAQGAVGKQDANTLNQVSLKKFFENERNNILLAAKGTQTEGDAKRALDQIISTTDWNSNSSVSQALSDLKALKQRQVDANQVYVDTLSSGRAMPGAKKATPEAPTGSSKVPYAAIRSYKGWENATNAEIDAAIKSGTIKLSK
jgi:hypothetical protein